MRDGGKSEGVSPITLMIDYMRVSINGGTPRWFVRVRENPMKMNDLGVPPFMETPV